MFVSADASLSDRTRFDWRLCLTKLSADLSNQLLAILHAATQSALHDECELLEKTGTIRSAPMTVEIITHGYDYPKFISAVSSGRSL